MQKSKKLISINYFVIILASIINYTPSHAADICEVIQKSADSGELIDCIRKLSSKVNELQNKVTELKPIKGDPGTPGEVGVRGPAGSTGERGPEGKPWRPKIHFDNLSNNKSNPKDMKKNLGSHAFCALSRSGTSHASQACTCTVTGKANSTWQLSLSLDENVKGRCNCGAICIDP